MYTTLGQFSTGQAALGTRVTGSIRNSVGELKTFISCGHDLGSRSACLLASATGYVQKLCQQSSLPKQLAKSMWYNELRWRTCHLPKNRLHGRDDLSTFLAIGRAAFYQWKGFTNVGLSIFQLIGIQPSVHHH
jgi:hypothetical protein